MLFSSISATWGSNDHGAYAAGNSFLDALAEERRARGLPATSIAWGVWDTRDWDEVDAVLDQGAGRVTPSRLRRQGMHFLNVDRALTALGEVLNDDETFIAVADVEWRKFAPVFSVARPRPLLETIPEAREETDPAGSAESQAAERGEYASRLAGMPVAERRRTVIELVRSHAATVLGYESIAEMPAERAFRDVGFDSLTAVELRNRLGAAAGVRLPATVVFDHPNPTAMADYLLAELVGHSAVLDEFDRLAAGLTPSDDAERAEIVARLEALTQRFRALQPEAAADEAEQRQLQGATAEEMFALLEDELDDPDFD
ncbi:Erythronolide synthase, modules 1 and 2 [Streptomyces sp. MP131-18]|nr:Erythronolide synthase, modules 1 and 2 [Streptomyces sp. MP131-18]